MHEERRTYLPQFYSLIDFLNSLSFLMFFFLFTLGFFFFFTYFYLQVSHVFHVLLKKDYNVIIIIFKEN